ncbi:MAG: A/G-specific adenine glycosylase [Planctomycetota bacterium]|nr:MAG: A/G-specific adenine glycosylase [Planctomycetota bacterium]
MAAPALPQAAQRALLRWYRTAARALPWRRTRDPWRVWVAEAMLQQTRVEAVRQRYEEFLARYPSPAALAAAAEHEVVEAWAGLGYYRRARALWAAARRCCALHGGRVPAEPAALAALPGVGAYTAGAIASIAFGAAVPALDGNAVRVLARLLAVTEDVSRVAARRRLETEAAALALRAAAEPDGPGAWNQALMELGARVCLPRAPRCDAGCPVRRWCGAARAGIAAELPRKPARRAPRPVQLAVGCTLDADRRRVLVVRRPAGGLLGLAWALPAVEGGRAELGAALGARVGRELLRWRHAFTHRVWHARLYQCTLHGAAPPGARWLGAAALRRRGFPTAFRPAVAAALELLRAGRGAHLASDPRHAAGRRQRAASERPRG